MQGLHSGTKRFVIPEDSDLRRAEFSSINHHPDIQGPLHLARTHCSTPTVARPESGKHPGNFHPKESDHRLCPSPLLTCAAQPQKATCSLSTWGLPGAIPSVWWQVFLRASFGSRQTLCPQHGLEVSFSAGRLLQLTCAPITVSPSLGYTSRTMVSVFMSCKFVCWTFHP